MSVLLAFVVVGSVDGEYKRTSFDPSAPGLLGLEWDSAELFRVSHTWTD